MFSSYDTKIFVCSIFLTTDKICFLCLSVVCFTKFLGFFISLFMLLHSLNTLFTETNSSWLIYKSIKVLETKTLILFKFFLAIYMFALFTFVFLIIELYFLIYAVNTHFFNWTDELVMPIETPTNEINAENEIKTMTAKMKIRKCSK